MVNRGHQQVFVNSSRLRRSTDMGVVSLCLSRQDASTDMQHDLLRSACDLALRSNMDPDLLRSSCICIDAPFREEHDVARIMPLAFLVRKFFLQKMFLTKTAIWAVFVPCCLNR